jgi:hypothetical protein
MLTSRKRKNADYCNYGDSKNADPFRNFKLIEAFFPEGTVIKPSAEIFLFGRLTDKMARIATGLSGKDMRVKDESIMDTISDARNYLCFA